MNNEAPILLLKSLFILLAINLVGQIVLFCRITLALGYPYYFPIAGICTCILTLVLAVMMIRRARSYSVGVIIGSVFSVLLWLFVWTMH